MSDNTVEFAVVGGMCRLKFRPGSSSGRGEDTNPGVSFDFISETSRLLPGGDGKFYGGMGVFARSDAKRLADMIYAFLEANPPPLIP